MSYYDPNQGEPPRRGGGGLMGRLLLAAIIAVVGLFMYWSRSEKNPVTGEYQRVAISPKQEIVLGLESAPQMAQEMGGELSERDPRTQLVQSVGKKLLETKEAQVSPWKFQFHLLADSNTVNAFALPGGQIFITLGLLSKLNNESELAGVLGHEMGHVIERHAAQQMAKNSLGQWIMVAISTGVSDPGDPQSAQTPLMIASLVNQMIQLRYSRHDESQADVWGLKLLEESGWDPYSMIDVMEVLKASSEGKSEQISLFQSHPDPDLRIEQIKAYLKENPPPPNLSKGKKLTFTKETSPQEELFRLFDWKR